MKEEVEQIAQDSGEGVGTEEMESEAIERTDEDLETGIKVEVKEEECQEEDFNEMAGEEETGNEGACAAGPSADSDKNGDKKTDRFVEM